MKIIIKMQMATTYKCTFYFDDVDDTIIRGSPRRVLLKIVDQIFAIKN